MDNTISVGVKFRDLTEITLQELQMRTRQIDDISIECGRNAKVQGFDIAAADVYYYFIDRSNAYKFYKRADSVPSVAHCVWDNQPLFEQP